jgi:NAD+ kinase
VTLELMVNGHYVTTYRCDGVVVSTPTGSTGHSLSAGGPILMPESSALVISPICPHTLSSRPLVLADESDIEILVKESPEGLLVSVDGQISEPLRKGASIAVTRSDFRVRFLHLPGHDHFTVLRHKLHWRGSSV